MKKIIYSKFGDSNVLQVAEVPIPAVQETSILIRVKAVSINPLDWKIRNGEMKLMSGSKFPKGVGIDFAGIIEETGAAVSKYKKGDEVFGILDVFKGGALSEYILASEKEIAIKPSNITFEQAAAMAVVGSAALQIFDTLITLKKGTQVLINGASGGIGMFATQFAKKSGAIVNAVVGDKGVQLVKDWGADFVLNYTKEDILKGSKQYDVVIDLSGKIPYNLAKQIMSPSSVYIHTSPGPKEIISSFLINLFSSKKYKVLLLKPSTVYLNALANETKKGIIILLSKVYSFNQFQDAFNEDLNKGVVGKSVISLDN
jgi:NADPH:quinone reductase-like Zn-dependent oxidoreductase